MGVVSIVEPMFGKVAMIKLSNFESTGRRMTLCFYKKRTPPRPITEKIYKFS